MLIVFKLYPMNARNPQINIFNFSNCPRFEIIYFDKNAAARQKVQPSFFCDVDDDIMDPSLRREIILL